MIMNGILALTNWRQHHMYHIISIYKMTSIMKQMRFEIIKGCIHLLYRQQRVDEIGNIDLYMLHKHLKMDNKQQLIMWMILLTIFDITATRDGEVNLGCLIGNWLCAVQKSPSPVNLLLIIQCHQQRSGCELFLG